MHLTAQKNVCKRGIDMTKDTNFRYCGAHPPCSSNAPALMMETPTYDERPVAILPFLAQTYSIWTASSLGCLRLLFFFCCCKVHHNNKGWDGCPWSWSLEWTDSTPATVLHIYFIHCATTLHSWWLNLISQDSLIQAAPFVDRCSYV